ncbi:F510_1955 family glycosylhydrolase [Microbacterium yannicii]|uniref:F510_1955 family glycosylhydrolase n=1 Tax=Microbacterium yannicii TaxID=671622 RepID=UPI0004745D54|nr:sialidase family protein [Microbacterium yannicii]
MRIHLRATTAVVAFLTLTLTGCTPANPPSTGAEHSTNALHVHGIVSDPQGTGFLLGTHGGIYRASAEGELGRRVGGNDFDAMGLTRIGDELIASGHPGSNTPAELGEQNLGIIRSSDGGATWEPVAYTGEKDFHALTASPDGDLYGQAADSNLLLKSTDLGATWNATSGKPLAFGLAVDATGRIIATTIDGPQFSNDHGASFTPLVDAPDIQLISASPSNQRLVGVDSEGAIWTSTADDTRWHGAGTAHGTPQAIAITDAGEILIADDSGLTLLPVTR